MRTNIFSRIMDFINRKVNNIKYWEKKGLIIGNNCEIYQSASFGSEPYLIKIGNRVRINKGVEFITHDGGIWVIRNLTVKFNDPKLKNADLIKRIEVGNNVHIGTNAIIMPGVKIGNNCIIGCGAIVTKDIPSNSIAVGIPARIIETLDEYYIKNKDKFVYTKKMPEKSKKKYLLNKDK